MRDLALIYSLPPEPQYLKSLLLFFDGLLFLGDPRHVTIGMSKWPELYEPLFESKVAQHISTDSVFDDSFTEAYAVRLNRFLDAGVFDDYQPKLQPGQYMFLEQMPVPSRDWQKNRERTEETLLAQVPGLVERLRSRGLLADIDLTKAWYYTGTAALGVDRRLRSITTALVSQLARTSLAQRVGAVIHPIAESDDALSETLELPRSPSRGQIVLSDLELVSPALGMVPLPDILEFRDLHKAEFQAYTRSLRQFVSEISPLSSSERAAAYNERKHELKGQAKALKDRAITRWSTGTGLLLGIAGAAWTAATGDPIGAALAGASSLLGFGGADGEPSAYSYLAGIKALDRG